MTTRKLVDLAEARQDRERSRPINDFVNTLSVMAAGGIEIEKNRLPEGLKAKFECILACPYEDFQQSLDVVLDVLITIRFERDAEEPEAS
jgi:hypothetical protein